MYQEEIEMLLTSNNNLNNEDLNFKFEKLLSDAIAEEGLSDFVIETALKGIKIDQGKKVSQYLLTCSNKEISAFYTKIKNNSMFNKNIYGSSYSFLCILLLAMVNMQKPDKKLFRYIIKTLPHMSKTSTGYFAEYNVNMLNYFIYKLPSQIELPQLEDINCTTTEIDRFSILIKDVINSLDKIENQDISDKIFKLNKWIVTTSQSDKEVIIKEDHKNLPVNDIISGDIKKSIILDERDKSEKKKVKVKTKGEQLRQLAVYFSNLENEINRSNDLIENQNNIIQSLKHDIDNIKEKVLSRDIKIKELEMKMSTQRFEIETLNKEISCRDSVLSVYDKDKSSSQNEMLKGISSSLAHEYRDFYDSINSEMSEILGEVYREKIKDIFKILKKNGIILED